jgi:hypothetical protein
MAGQYVEVSQVYQDFLIFPVGWKPVTFLGMTARPDKTPTKSLRDAYKVSGFHVRARIDSYDELDHPAFVVTLDRRSKKRCAAGAGRFAAAVTTSAGDGRAILAAAIGKSISIFTCTESPARTVA